MNRSRFLSLFLTLVVGFLFVKIYQHNKIVKLIYEKQRVEKLREKSIKEKNRLLVELYKLKNPSVVRKRASELLGMVDLKPSQLITVTWQV